MASQAPDQGLDASFLAEPPRFFSLAFHFSFLPRVIAFRIAQYRRNRNMRRHVYMEIPLIIFACGTLIVLGLPSAIDHHAIPGIASSVLGAGGLITLIVWSVYSEYRNRKQQGYRYDYAVFMPTVFFFCLLLGGWVGLLGYTIAYNASGNWYLWAAPGLLCGYVAGIFAARWIHVLGFMAQWFIYLAILGLVFLPIEYVLMLWIFASKHRVWNGG